ncbi:hypothetical protein HDU82_000312 [Entophlyctis luteolus]|nr:hypothetical protein HDU82_000312 [Entophlyctis luteolus]
MGSLVHVPALSLAGFDLAAFGDFNSDKATDLLVRSRKSGSDIVSVLAWDSASAMFKPFNGSCAFNPNDISAWGKLVNVIHADFDRDGRMDLLLMAESSQSKDELLMKIVWCGSSNSSITDLPSAAISLGQPFMIDYDGENAPALLGYLLSDPPVLSVYNFGHDRNVSITKADFARPSGAQMCEFSSPHSNAFVDLNGDCLADIFVTCHDKKMKRDYFQVWTNSRDDGFALAFEQILDESSRGPITFADVDADGAVDIVFGSCDSSSCRINVFYNSQIPLCTSSISKTTPCRSADELCSADPLFNFKNTNSAIELDSILNSGEKLDLSMPLRLGDFDKDGYPDILILTHDSKRKYIRLLRSVSCTKIVCLKNEIAERRRTFKAVSTGVDSLNSFETEIMGATFFDLYEDEQLCKKEKMSPHIME